MKARLEPIVVGPLGVGMIVWAVAKPHRVGFTDSENAVGNVPDCVDGLLDCVHYIAGAKSWMGGRRIKETGDDN